MDLSSGMVVQLKKKHPCGSDTWKILRIAQDAKIQCQGCGAMIRRKRASRLTQYPQRYRCAKCGGKLKIISQDAISSR